MQKIEGVTKFTVRLAQVIETLLTFAAAITLNLALDATRPLPEPKWSLPSSSRQGFLTSGSSASLHGLPNFASEISGHTDGS